MVGLVFVFSPHETGIVDEHDQLFIFIGV